MGESDGMDINVVNAYYIHGSAHGNMDVERGETPTDKNITSDNLDSCLSYFLPLPARGSLGKSEN